MGVSDNEKCGPFPGKGDADNRSERDRNIETLIARVEDLLALRPFDNAHARAEASEDEAPTASRAAEFTNRPLSPKGFPEGRAAFARDLMRQRRKRSDHLPAALFAEPAWDMLLDLYAAHYEGKPVSTSSLCIAANVPSTTALRAIQTMSDEGCLVRQRDPTDGRRVFIALSDKARASLDAYFDEMLL
jgi:DNA-binding MarR family transcriptional regulator